MPSIVIEILKDIEMLIFGGTIMFNLLLGAADSKAVTKEDLLEFENSVYGQMKDVQDIARNVQADQISFLNSNITIFLTVAGLIIAIISIIAGFAFNTIKKNSEEAKQKMNVATDMMKQAEEKTKELDLKLKEVDQTLEDTKSAQVNLKDLINSKELEEKIKGLEKSAETTLNLEKNVRAHYSLQYAKQLTKDTVDTYTGFRDYYRKNPKLVADAEDAIAQCETLASKVYALTQQHYIIQDHPSLVLPLNHYQQIEKVSEEAKKLNGAANSFYQSYVMPAVEEEFEEYQKASKEHEVAIKKSKQEKGD